TAPGRCVSLIVQRCIVIERRLDPAATDIVAGPRTRRKGVAADGSRRTAPRRGRAHGGGRVFVRLARSGPARPPPPGGRGPCGAERWGRRRCRPARRGRRIWPRRLRTRTPGVLVGLAGAAPAPAPQIDPRQQDDAEADENPAQLAHYMAAIRTASSTSTAT